MDSEIDKVFRAHPFGRAALVTLDTHEWNPSITVISMWFACVNLEVCVSEIEPQQLLARLLDKIATKICAADGSALAHSICPGLTRADIYGIPLFYRKTGAGYWNEVTEVLRAIEELLPRSVVWDLLPQPIAEEIAYFVPDTAEQLVAAITTARK